MSQSMDRRQLPQPVGVPSTRSRAIASASKTLVTRFPTLANAVEKRFGDPTERVRDFEETRTNRKMFDTKGNNVTQVDQIVLNVDEQNNILRQIIDELKKDRGGPEEDGSMDLPRLRGTRGRGRGRIRIPPSIGAAAAPVTAAVIGGASLGIIGAAVYRALTMDPAERDAIRQRAEEQAAVSREALTPGQQSGRGIGQGLRSGYYGNQPTDLRLEDILDVLDTPAENETPEQRNIREGMTNQLTRGNGRPTPEIIEYVRARRARTSTSPAATPAQPAPPAVAPGPRTSSGLSEFFSRITGSSLARPVSQRRGSDDFVDALTSHEFDEINVEADEIEFDGEVSFETERASQPSGYLTPVASFTTERIRQAPFVPGRAAATSSMDVMEPSETQQVPTPTAAPEPSYQAPAAPQAQQPSQVAAPRISTRSAAPPRISTRPSEVTPQTPVTTAPAAAPSEPPVATQQPQAQSATPAEGGGDFMSQLRAMSSRLGVSAENMVAIMRSESSLNPQAVNPTTGASGLIQFMPRTARSLGTTVEDIRRMSAVEQLPFVERFFRSVGVQPGSSAGRLYAYVFLPGRANREVLTERGESFYEANRGLDMDRDGRITIADLDARLARFGGTLASESGGMVAADQAANRTARGGGGRPAMGQSAAATSPGRVEPQRVTRDVPLNRRLEGQAT